MAAHWVLRNQPETDTRQADSIALLANKLPAALAAGNCVVIKPSEHTSATTVEFCRLAEQAGFPPGVINLVTGDARVGKALVTAKGLDRISLTGSTSVGREIAASAGKNLVPVTMELGGKSPNIVFADADFEKALVGLLREFSELVDRPA